MTNEEDWSRRALGAPTSSRMYPLPSAEAKLSRVLREMRVRTISRTRVLRALRVLLGS